MEAFKVAIGTSTTRFRIAFTLAAAAATLHGCTSDPANSHTPSGNAAGDAGAPASAGSTAIRNSSSTAMGGQSGTASNGGNAASTGGNAASTGGNAASTGGTGGKGATTAIGGSSGGTSQPSACSASNLVWKTANKTNYTSYPDPGSEECIKYNGCTWAGQFAACDATKPEAWVSTHNIVAAFPNFQALKLHDLCLRKGSKTIVVTVLDTCGDSDCDGCCTQNKGTADELIDIESYTDTRWGVPDGPIEWADLGQTKGSGCN
ncbi:MAG TPA: hypothetical protein VIV60_05820 [Polyangiaceae bacterium]